MRSTMPENTLGTPHATVVGMVPIEMRRFVRHPMFLIGAALAYAITVWVIVAPTHSAAGGPDRPTDLISTTIVPAFFIGLPSLIVAARLTRSTDVSLEAVSTAPGTEARRTLAVAGACAVPLAAGVIWLVELLVLVSIRGHYSQELWFGTLPAVDVVSILLAAGVVPCLGAALLGVLVGRWLRFPGAPIVVVVLLTAVVTGGQAWYDYSSTAARFRLYLPWVIFQPGTFSEAGGYQGIPQFSQALLPGNPIFYLLYLLGLCALAVGGAVWHDRTARSPKLTVQLLGLVGLTVLALGLAVSTGNQEIFISEPLPILPAP